MTTASFWIEIIPKPIYVGGTGPPMAPITLLPEQDEESWVIAEVIEYNKVPHYVVHPKDKPVVRKIIAKNVALDWVSPLVYEMFEMEEGLRRDAREEELRLEKERSKLTKKGKKRGRPFRNRQMEASALVESIEPETDTPDDTAQPSDLQPSLSQPNLRMDSPFDTEATEDETISRTMEPPPSKRSRTSTSEVRLSSKPPRNPQEPLSSPQTVQKKNLAPTSKSHPRSKYTAEEPSTPRHSPSPFGIRTSETRALRDRSAQPFYGRQRSQTVQPPQSASPAKSQTSTTVPRQPTRSSSRSGNATPSYGGVQKGRASAPPKPSTSSPPPKRSKSKFTTSTPSKPAPPPASSSANKNDTDITDGKQWKVVRLLDDKWEMKTQRRCHYYLTQWAGDYEPTWERSTNITSDLKIEYENWMKTPEGKAHKANRKSVEKSAKSSIERDVVVASGIKDERPRSRGSSFSDDQEQVSKQLGAHAAQDDNTRTTDSPDPLVADTPTTAVKREQSSESVDQLQLARSPFFPSSQAAAEAAESESESEE
ncbi:hypothetical protein V501_03027 [Pseudogymnoascus sp. VKM F-4519 (FW-2642)]|nr:hypothetical protein V501_03027 [Pseudogymnoascus sp. VKM F-4519 (FW-2642)]